MIFTALNDDKFIYFPPDGTWKMTDTQFLSLLTIYYGLEQGMEMYKTRQRVTLQCVQKFWSDYLNLVIFGDFQNNFRTKFRSRTKIFERAVQIRGYSEYQLALLVLKVLCSLTIEGAGDEPVGNKDFRDHIFKTISKHEQVLLTTLNQHFDQMLKVAGMTDAVQMFKDLIYKDYKRVTGCVYHIKSFDCVVAERSGQMETSRSTYTLK